MNKPQRIIMLRIIGAHLAFYALAVIGAVAGNALVETWGLFLGAAVSGGAAILWGWCLGWLH